MVTLTQILLIIVITVLTVILTAIGIQFFLLIKEMRQTLARANSIMDDVGELINKISHPASSMNNLLTGLREGVNLIDTVTGLFRRKDNTNDYVPYDENL